MKILVADIGGTNSRFAVFELITGEPPLQKGIISFATHGAEIHSFRDLVDTFLARKTVEFGSSNDYKTAVFAVAGPVRSNRCRPSNIRFPIDAGDITEIDCKLINDFTAQAYACVHPKIVSEMVTIQEGEKEKDGVKAIVGAGTGLGHCALVPNPATQNNASGFTAVPSEAGHAGFQIHSDREEMDFEKFVQKKLAIPYLYGDLIVSGTGLSLIHEFLTGNQLSPKEVVDSKTDNQDTVALFSRFYGRACRNYALSVLSTGGLIISGGIAAKNPTLVRNSVFIEEFTNSPTQHGLLSRIPILLNRQENIGLLGAALYAKMLIGVK